MMTLIYKFILVIFLFFIGVFSFILNRKHLLSTLLSLEFMVLSLFFIFMLFLNMFNYETYFIVLFLIFMVCEGALGISILVSLIRSHGNDFFSIFSILQC